MKYSKIPHAISSFVLAAALCMTASTFSSANERTRCQHRVENAEQHYRHEVHVHGKHSRQAEKARAKLNELWTHCWREAHAWYDPYHRQWRTDRDWDRNYDWDRYR